LSESALEDIDLTDDQYALASNKNNKDIDFDALLEARMLDEVRCAALVQHGSPQRMPPLMVSFTPKGYLNICSGALDCWESRTAPQQGG